MTQKLTFNARLLYCGQLAGKKSWLPLYFSNKSTCESVGSYKTKWVIKAALHFLLATTDNFLPLQPHSNSGSFNFILILNPEFIASTNCPASQFSHPFLWQLRLRNPAKFWIFYLVMSIRSCPQMSQKFSKLFSKKEKIGVSNFGFESQAQIPNLFLFV